MSSSLLQSILVQVDANVDAASKALNSVSKDVGHFGEQVAKVNGGAGGLDGVLGSVSGRLSGVAGAFSSAGVGAGVLAAAAGGAAIEVTRMAEENERAFRRVATQLDQPVSALQGLRNAARDFSSEFAVGQAEVLALMNNIAKDGAGGAEGVRAMTRAALELSAATGDDAGGLAKILDQVSDGFGITSERAEEAAAALFSVGRGKVSIEDIGDALKKTASAANRGKIDFETMAAAATTLVDRGLPIKEVSKVLIQNAEAGERGRKALEALAHESPIAADGVDKLRRASEENVPAIEKFKVTLGNLLESMGQTGPAERLLGVLKEITHELQSGAEGTRNQLIDQLNSFETNQKRPAPGAGGRAVLPSDLLSQLAHRNDLTVGGGNIARLVQDLGKTDEGLSQLTTAQVARLYNSIGQYRRLTAAETDARREAVYAQLAVEAELVKRAQKTPPLSGGRAVTEKAKSDADIARDQQKALAETERREAALQSINRATAALSPDPTDNIAEQVKTLREAAVRAAKGLSTEALPGFLQEVDAGLARLRQAAVDRIAYDRDQTIDQLQGKLVEGLNNAVKAAQLKLHQFLDESNKSLDKGAQQLGDPHLNDAQRAEIRERLAREAEVRDQLRAQYEEMVALAQASQDLDDHLKSVETRLASGARPLLLMRELLEELDKAEAIAFDPHDVGGPSRAARDAALERAKKIREDITKLQERGAQTSKAEVDRTKDEVGRVEQLAGGLKNAANAAAGLLTVLGQGNGELAHMLTSVAGVAGGVEDLSKAAKAAGGFGNLFSSASGLVSAAGPIGAVIAGGAGIVKALGGLLGGNDAATKAIRESIEKNVEALHQNTTKLGQLDLGKTGTYNANAVAAAREIAALFTGKDAGKKGSGVADDRNAILAKYGLTLTDLKNAAAALGITLGSLDNSKEADTLKQFLEAAGTPNAQASDIDQRLSILGGTAAEKLNTYLQTLTTIPDTLTQKSGSVAKAILQQFDLSTDDGRKAAEDYVRAQYAQNKSITGDLAEKLLALIDAAGTEAQQSAATATGSAAADGRTAAQVASGAASLTEATGLSLADLTRTGVTLQRQQLDVQRQELDLVQGLLAAVRGVTPTAPIAPPLLPGYGLPAVAPTSAPSGSRIEVTFTNAQFVLQGASPEEFEASARAAAQGFANGMLDRLDDVDAALARRAQQRQLAAGVLPGQVPLSYGTGGLR